MPFTRDDQFITDPNGDPISGGGTYYGILTYTDCYDIAQTVYLYQGQSHTFCARPGTISYDGVGNYTENGTCTVTYYYTRTQTFTKNNCGDGKYGSTYSFSKTYTSTISQLDAQNTANSDTSFETEGQAAANANGTCTLINYLVSNVITPNEDGINDYIGIYQDYNNGSSRTLTSGGKTWYEVAIQTPTTDSYVGFSSATMNIWTSSGRVIFTSTGLKRWRAIGGYWKVGDCKDGNLYDGFFGFGRQFTCNSTVQAGDPWIGLPYYYQADSGATLYYQFILNDGTGRKLQGFITLITVSPSNSNQRRMAGPYN